jgi:hypothetical protein
MSNWEQEVTWRQLVEKDIKKRGGTDFIVDVYGDVDKSFERGLGDLAGPPFIIWTAERVYFATQYDGSESLNSVPRYPETLSDGDGEHLGGDFPKIHGEEE